MMLLVLGLGIALAEQAVSMEVIHTVHAPKHPALKLKVNVPASSLDVTLQCGDVTASHRSAARSGELINIPIKVSPGTHACTGTLDAEFEDGTAGSMSLSFQVAVQSPIQMSVTMDDLHLKQGQLRVHTNQPVERVDIEVFDEHGAVVGTSSAPGTAASSVVVQWTPVRSEVTRLKVTATGSTGLSTTLDLFPWQYAIPHDDVVFPSGSAEIPPSEVHKLRAAKQTMDATLRRFQGDKLGFEIPMQLFVAGYTDTVGNRVNNQRLSQARARSIGLWFRSNGFERPIHFQGFGENGLAVSTPDETNEPANRRAAYIVAAEQPGTTQSTPAENWSQLR